MQKKLYDEVIDQEIIRDRVQDKMVARKKAFNKQDEETKGPTAGRTLREQA
jgi:hypothetical protein